MTTTTIDETKTAQARRKWDQNARWYDWMGRLMEKGKAKEWTARTWEAVKGDKVLEVAVGTGRNMPYYPKGVNVTAIDFSAGMLARAKKRAHDLGVQVDLRQMDVQKLEFSDDSFDTVVATCTFCSVPDPVLGLQEIRRVLKPGGQAVLLEHMRHDNRFVGALMDCLNSLVRLIGPSINRRTLDNIRKAGLEIETAENLSMGGIVKLIVARPGKRVHSTYGFGQRRQPQQLAGGSHGRQAVQLSRRHV